MKKMIFVIIGIVLVIGIIVLLYFRNRAINRVEIGEFKYFHFSYSNGYEKDSNISYDVECKDKCIATIKPYGVSEEDATIVELDDETVNEIISVLKKYEVEKWNGFSKHDKYVLDGDSFSLNVRMKNDDYLSASGYMMWPNNYGKVCGELDSIFGRYIKK